MFLFLERIILQIEKFIIHNKIIKKEENEFLNSPENMQDDWDDDFID